MSRWDSAHPAVPGSTRSFGPLLHGVHGRTVASFTEVSYAGHDRDVVGYTEAFAAHTGQVQAVTIAARQLPSDAHIVDQVLGGSCELVDYHSHALEKSSPTSSGVVVLRLTSATTTYDPREVAQAAVSRTPVSDGC